MVTWNIIPYPDSSFDFQYYKTYKMVNSIDSMHLNYDHMYPMQFI